MSREGGNTQMLELGIKTCDYTKCHSKINRSKNAVCPGLTDLVIFQNLFEKSTAFRAQRAEN